VRERVRARALGVLFLPSPAYMCSVYVCVCVCMYACVRACVCACVHRKEATNLLVSSARVRHPLDSKKLFVQFGAAQNKQSLML